MKVLLDTCVIIDALQNRQPFSTDAEKIFILAANKQIDAFITAKSLTDIYYLTHRATHSNETTKDIINKLLTLFNLLDTSGKDCINALYSGISDYEDAVMEQTAIRNKIDVFVTRNIDDYKNAKIRVVAPNKLIDSLMSTTPTYV